MLFLGQSKPTSATLKPEDDILYQWRLRRKIEEAQKDATIQVSSQNQADKQQSQQKLISTEVQTISKVDLGTQTSLEINKHVKSESKDVQEKPTKEESCAKKSPPHILKSTSLSPTKKNYTDKPVEDSNSKDNNKSNFALPSSVLAVNSSISSCTTTSSSLSASTITNITSRVASPNPKEHFSESKRYINSFDDKEGFKASNKYSSSDIEDALFENDEILQMLFLKKNFYQYKLK